MSPLDALSPDQRAVIQLVLQQERSYEDLAGMLGIATEGVRARAVAGLEAVAGDGGLSAGDRAFVTDYLLGQLGVAEREQARRLLSSTPDAREWALDVSYELESLAGDALPEIPAGEEDPVPAATAPIATQEPVEPTHAFDAEPEPFDEEPEDAPEPVAAEAEPHPRPRPRPRPRPQPEGTRSGAGPDRPRASRLGGALLIFGLACVIAVVLYAVLSGDDEPTERASNGTPTPTATAGADQPRELFAVPLTAVGGGDAEGTMAVYQQDEQVFFALEAQNVPKEKEGEAYAIWFIGGGKSRRLGYFQQPVQEGRIGTVGPDQKDLANFPRWLTTYKRVVISRETRSDAAQPGPIILSGNLPGGSA
jgi:Anti-sigma-K factor rskA/Sigma-70, region 4